MNPVFNLPKIHPAAANQEGKRQAMSAVQTDQLRIDIVISDQNRNEFAARPSRLLALEADEITEKIRTLGIFVPGSYDTLAGLTLIDEETDESNAEDMIRQLVLGQETVIRSACAAFPISEQPNDKPTIDLLAKRCRYMRKTHGCLVTCCNKSASSGNCGCIVQAWQWKLF